MSGILVKNHGEKARGFLKLGHSILWEIPWTNRWSYFACSDTSPIVLEKRQRKQNKQWYCSKAWRIRRFVLGSSYQLQKGPSAFVNNCNQMFQQYLPKGFWKNSKNNSKISSWAVGTAYSNTPFKPTVEEFTKWQCFKGEQANKNKAIWIGFCIY